MGRQARRRTRPPAKRAVRPLAPGPEATLPTPEDLIGREAAGAAGRYPAHPTQHPGGPSNGVREPSVRGPPRMVVRRVGSSTWAFLMFVGDVVILCCEGLPCVVGCGTPSCWEPPRM